MSNRTFFSVNRVAIRSIFVLCLGLGLSNLRATETPLNEVPDAVGKSLQQHMIWISPEAKPESTVIAFRKSFVLPTTPDEVALHLFADARYMVWINGTYVLRGPARFESTGPEYDTLNIAPFLKSGSNQIAVTVMAYNERGGSGKIRKHAPGFTARIDVNGSPLVSTDSDWKWSDRTRYRTPTIDWANITDRFDARVEDGDWTQLDYQDSAWKNAAPTSGAQWGPLSARRTPLLRDTPVPVTFADGKKFPIELKAGEKLKFTTGRLVQAYAIVELDADADSTLSLNFAGSAYNNMSGVQYAARAGHQSFITSDTQGFADGSLTVKSGKITITGFQLIERLYPFDVVGSFKSSDELLNKLWDVCARSGQVLSEDAYIDCADRERVEWMDCDPPSFDITRTAMAGPGTNNRPAYADARLLGAMLRRTALTVQPDGWVKAHTASERFDIHAKMEDRACDWVEGARRYYESTGDASLIREIWPVIVRQLDYFLERRTSRGLVRAREWVFSGNPVAYVTGEGTGLNAFVYKALVDAAYLGNIIGEKSAADKFTQASQELATAFNKVLWDEKAGTYYSGYYSEEDHKNETDERAKKMPLKVENNLIEPTMYAALWALDQGLVPPARRASVTKYLLDNRQVAYPEQWFMTYYYLFGQMYAANDPALDTEILQYFRTKLKAMANSPWQVTWEHMIAGSRAHCYGMFPGYFLSSYVLGVRLDGPASEHRLIIDPRLGDLKSAEGVVVTEFGPVPVSWKLAEDHLDFEFQVPAGVTASLQLPSLAGKATLVLDGTKVARVADAAKIKVEVKSGIHRGKLTFPAGLFASANSKLEKNFHDDFANENPLWQPASGTWKADAGIYQQSGTALAVTGLKNLILSDATYSFSIQLDKTGEGFNWAGFQFRKPTVGSTHDEGGYLVYLRDNGAVEFFNGQVLQSVKTGLNPTDKIRFKIVAQEDHFLVFLNDETKPQIDVRNAESTEGYIGFTSLGTNAKFGPLSVMSGSGK